MTLPVTGWSDEPLPGQYIILVTDEGEFIDSEGEGILIVDEEDGTTWTDE